MVVEYWDEELERVYQEWMTTGGGGGSSQLWMGVLQESQVVPPTGSVGGGTVLASLNDRQTALRYFIRINPALQLAMPPANPTDVTAVHLHIGPVGVNGQHLLNIYGFPSQDDAQMTVLTNVNGIIGRWDDGDATGPAANQSKPLTANITPLFSESTYLQIHTMQFPTGAVRAQLELFP